MEKDCLFSRLPLEFLPFFQLGFCLRNSRRLLSSRSPVTSALPCPMVSSLSGPYSSDYLTEKFILFPKTSSSPASGIPHSPGCPSASLATPPQSLFLILPTHIPCCCATAPDPWQKKKKTLEIYSLKRRVKQKISGLGVYQHNSRDEYQTMSNENHLLCNTKYRVLRLQS